MVGLLDYPKSAQHPAFNVSMRTNFVNGGEENQGFRFIGSKGVMTVGRDVTLSASPEEAEPGLTIGTFAEKTQEEIKKAYIAKYPHSRYNSNYRPTPLSMKPDRHEVFSAPPQYSDHYDHLLNWAHAIRSRKPVIEDGAFGFRAAGPALLSNLSYFEKKIVRWDPVNMKLVGA
jgi:hypothetical protein